jgi:hypothetical protein
MVFVGIFLTFISISSYHGGESYSDEILAYVERRPITRSLVLSFMRTFGEKNFDSALETIIDLFVVLEYASRQNIKIPQEQIDSIIEKLHMKDISSVEKELQRNGMTLQEYRDFIRAKRISDEIFFQLVGSNFITNKELQKFFIKNKEKIEKDFEKRFVFFLETSENDYNYDISRFKRLGWVRRDELSKIYDEAIFSKQTTGFCEIFEGNGRKIVFFVKEIKSPEFSEIKDDPNFRDYYIKEKYKEVFGTWVDVQKQKIFIKK